MPWVFEAPPHKLFMATEASLFKWKCYLESQTWAFWHISPAGGNDFHVLNSLLDAVVPEQVTPPPYPLVIWGASWDQLSDQEMEFVYFIDSAPTSHRMKPSENLLHWDIPNQRWDPRVSAFYLFIYFNWRLITLQYCSDFCHTLTWISHGCTCVPHQENPSHLPPHPIPSGSSHCTTAQSF